MKVITLLFCALSLIISVAGKQAKAQVDPTPWDSSELERNSGQTNYTERSDVENIIWYEDFADGLPESWLNINENGFCAFTHTYQGPQGPFSIGMPPLASETGSNGFMILDSDLCSSQNDDDELTNAWLQSPGIDLPGGTNLMLTFQHNFRYCCSASQTLIMAEVSTDSINWTSFDVRNGLGPNNSSANPVYQAIDVTELAQGATRLWFRFRKTGASHYWWMIDDIMLVSFVDNDLEVYDPRTVGGYTQIPDGQFPSFQPGAKVRNAGGQAQTNVVFTTTVNDYLYQSELTYPSMNPAQVISFNTSEAFVPPGRGLYELKYKVDQAENDLVPESNEISFSFSITDTTFSRTSGRPFSGFSLTAQPGISFGTAVKYTILQEVTATSLSVVPGEGAEEGAVVQAFLYQLIDDQPVVVAQSELYTLTAGDIADPLNQKIILQLPAETVLTSGSYLAAIQAPVQEEIVAIATTASFDQPDDAAFTWQINQWIALEDVIPAIDLHFGENLAACNPQVYFDVKPSLCSTASGQIEAIPLNGVAPYSITWTEFPEQEGPVIAGLASGIYNVTVVDAAGCQSEHQVEVADEPITVNAEITDAICNVDGVIELAPATGQEPFTFAWNHDAGLTGAMAEGLSSGNYQVTITDANSCEVTLSLQVDNIAELPVLVYVQDAFCGSESGTIELYPQAGTAPYNYQWVGLDGNSAEQQGLLAGNYAFTVTDANNCIFTGNAIINQDTYTLEAMVDKINPSCGEVNGSIALTILNGEGPYTYLWADGTEESELTDLAPGNYSVEMVDRFGCVGSVGITLQNVGSKPDITSEIQNSEGCGQALGSMLVTPTDPLDMYFFELVSGEGEDGGDPILSDEPQSQFLLENIAAGYYNLKITNIDGCEIMQGFSISDAGAPQVDADLEMVSCFGMADGAISLTVQGAADPVFEWNDESGSTTSTRSNLAAGQYPVTITDGGCISTTIFTITEPDRLLGIGEVQHIVCANEQLGGVTLSIEGGTSPYSYIWSNGFSGKNLENVTRGVYSVTVTDFNECVFQKPFIIEGNDSLLLDANIQHPEVGEDNGHIILLVSGGLGNYSFQWAHGPQSSVVTNLAEGNYSVSITDELGCMVEGNYFLSSVSVEPALSVKSDVLNIYPNPAVSHVNIDLPFTGTGTLEVLNIMGAVVLQQSAIGNENVLRLPISGLDRGVYIIRLSAGNSTWQSRLVKK